MGREPDVAQPVVCRLTLCYNSPAPQPQNMAATPTTAPAAAKAAPKPAAKALEPSGNIYTAIMAASLSFPAMTKDGVNTYLNSKYLTLGNLLNMIREPLAEQGVIITSSFVPGNGVWMICTRLVLVSTGEFIESNFPAPDLATQKMGGAATYGMRYNLMHLLGRAAEDDDDGVALAAPAPQGYAGPLPQGQQRNEPAQTPQHSQIGPQWL
jgi:hypothetical protein